MNTPINNDSKTAIMSKDQYSEDRKSKIDKARLSWINRLIDKSRRNNLLYYRDLKTGTVMLGDLKNESLKNFFNGETFNFAGLFDVDQRILQSAKLREIIKRNVANVEEKGLQTLFMAVGLATWDSVDGGTPTRAPLALIPLKIEKRGREQRDFTISQDGDIQFNMVLAKVLEDSFGIELDEESEIDAASQDGFDPLIMIESVKKACKKVSGFDVEQCAVIGNFSFQKMAMVRDLQEGYEMLLAHDLIAAIVGDQKSRESLAKNREQLDPFEFDRNEPKNELLIIDADSSQQKAIMSIRKEQNGVVQGPPGTGKSQTIANTIAALVADGKKVLFVAEKRAALEVVKSRLAKSGLDHLALDFHGADFSPRRIIDQINSCLEKIKHSVAIDSTLDDQKLISLRKRINSHLRNIHDKRSPSELSVYELQGKILSTSLEARLKIQWSEEKLKQLTPVMMQRLSELLVDASGFEDLFIRKSNSKWNGAKIPNAEAASHVIKLCKSITEDLIPGIESLLKDLSGKADINIVPGIKEIEEIIVTISNHNKILNNYVPEIYNIDLSQVASSLKPLEKPYQQFWHLLTDGEYRKSKNIVKSLFLKKMPLSKEILCDLQLVNEVRAEWHKLKLPSAQIPRQTIKIEEIKKSLSKLKLTLHEVNSFFEITPLNINELEKIAEVSRMLYTDGGTVMTMPKLFGIEKEIDNLGVNDFVSEIRQKVMDSKYWVESLYYVWYNSSIDHIQNRETELSGFKGLTHSKYVSEFKTIDKNHQKLSEAIIRHKHAGHAIEIMNKCYAQAQIIQRESQKRKKLMPLRKLLVEAEDVVTALFPCWMASPLSISQVTKANRQIFDVVLFDEASQVLPEDAIPAIMRAKQVVVAGDRHQLPPTTFFASNDDSGDSDSESETFSQGFESILDLMSTFLDPWWLEWHYRSKDERLIVFSNHHIYSNRLVSFPSAKEDDAIRHIQIEQKFLSDTEEDSSSEEVSKVVKLIFEHAENRPTESLGVITMGIKHAKRVEAEYERQAELRADLDEYFSPEKTERFFIKNLERVQGDERDAIIISIGYGKDRGGKLPHRFGPLLYDGGERRLNVAVTRARKRCTVVSSFSHHDIDLQKAKGKGVELLHHYLEFMHSGGRHLGDKGGLGIQMNEFEADIYNALNGRGIKLIPQYGSSKYRIDFAVVHPTKPGQMIMAMECDGAAYHSSPTATERDRIRQNHLEALGWTFYRIWSTDWFLNRDREIERFLSAYANTLKNIDKGTSKPDLNRDKENINNQEVIIQKRSRRTSPRLAKGKPIDSYSSNEIESIIDWVNSDGMMRTNQEIVEEVFNFLGYKRKGPKIQEVLNAAVKEKRRK